MKQHTQTILADPVRNDGHDKDGVPGDCLRTCVACLLDMEVLDVPHFGLEKREWWDAMQLWLTSQSFASIYVPISRNGKMLEWEYDEYSQRALWLADRYMGGLVLLGGPSPRGSFGHEVVGNTENKTVWDPHPSRAGLTLVEDAIVIVPSRWT